MSTLREQLQTIEGFIRAGDFGEAKKLLLKLRLSRKTQLEDRTESAFLWKRVGEPIRALKVLGSLEKLNDKMSSAERLRWIVYADCLLQINALGGVDRILSQGQLRSESRYHLIQAFYWMHSWDYEKSLIALRQFLKNEKLYSYNFFIGKINQLACLAFLEKSDEVIQEAEVLLPMLQHKGHLRLLSNCCEILLQVSLQQISMNSSKKIERIMKEFASTSLNESQLLENNYIQKWQSYLALRKGEAGALDRLAALRKSSIEKGYSEIVRDIDRVVGRETGDGELIKFLYFGTPYRAFVEHFKLEHPDGQVDISILAKSGKIAPPREAIGANYHFDLTEFFEEQGYSLPSKLLVAIFRDFYRAPTTVELFDAIYPSEYFQPTASLRKINQLVFRLNEVLQTKKVPFEIKLLRGGYRIISSKNILLTMQQPAWKLMRCSDVDLIRRQLQAKLPSTFSLQEAVLELNQKRRTTQNIIKSLVDGGHLQRQGQTSQVKYLWIVK